MWQTPRSDLGHLVELSSQEYVAQKVVIHHEWVGYSKKDLHSNEAGYTSRSHKEHQSEEPSWYANKNAVDIIVKGWKDCPL
jgi:hypothetical protein